MKNKHKFYKKVNNSKVKILKTNKNKNSRKHNKDLSSSAPHFQENQTKNERI